MVTAMPLAATARLIDRAIHDQDGDRGELLERLRARLLLWAAGQLRGELGDKVEADDVAQDVLLAVHRSFDGFQGKTPGEFLSWVFRIAENRLKDIAAHHGALKRKLPEPRSFTQTTPSERVSRAEQLGRVAGAIERLSEDYRRVIQLVRFEERSAEDAGKVMERSANAVRILYFRAIRALRDELA